MNSGLIREVEEQLEGITRVYLEKSKTKDPLKAEAIYREMVESMSAELVKQVSVKALFTYANRVVEDVGSDQAESQDASAAKVKQDVLDAALRVKSDYLRDVVPFNTNIAQHALFSANPKAKALATAHGVRTVYIKNGFGDVLTTYDARVMGAVQALWWRKSSGMASVELKYADIISELGITDGATNYKRIQDSLKRLKNIEVTLTRYQRSKHAEYEEIALTRLIAEIIFRRKAGTTDQMQQRFVIKFPQWLIDANQEGNLFDISLLLMNDLKSYLAPGLYWLMASYPDDPIVTMEISKLAGHFYFLDDNREPVIPVYKIIEKIKQACEELKEVGFIDHYEFSGKKQGLTERYLTVTKNPVFLNDVTTGKQLTEPEQLDLFNNGQWQRS